MIYFNKKWSFNMKQASRSSGIFTDGVCNAAWLSGGLTLGYLSDSFSTCDFHLVWIKQHCASLSNITNRRTVSMCMYLNKMKTKMPVCLWAGNVFIIIIRQGWYPFRGIIASCTTDIQCIVIFILKILYKHKPLLFYSSFISEGNFTLWRYYWGFGTLLQGISTLL